MTRALHVLVIEDSADDAELLLHALRQGELEVAGRRIETAEELLSALNERRWDLILADYQLPNFGMPAALRIVRESGLDIPFVVVSGIISMATAVDLMRAGAHDFVEKDDLVRLVPAVERELGEAEQRRRRRLAERAAREREARFRTLIENSLDVVAILDAQRVIRFTSPSVEAALGHDPATLVARDILEFVHAEDIAALREALSRFAAEPEYVDLIEFRWRHSDGSWRTFEAAGRRLPEDTSIGRILLNCRDVTERKALESRLQRRHRLEAVGQLTGGVAHDFNNLLTIMLGDLELLQPRLEGDAKAEQLVGQAIKAAERGADLTERLLNYSCRQALKPEPADANDVIVEMLDMVRRGLGETIEVETKLPPGAWPLFVDRGQLEGAILNLALNARDAMPSGGRLVLETANFRVDAAEAAGNLEAQPGDYVVVTVRDDGEGMAPAVAEHAVEPFFTTKGPGRGSGLGLSSVHGFVKQSGGFMTIESESGQGCAVRIHLPRAAQLDVAAERPAAPAGRPPSQDGLVLVVEDDPNVRELVVDLVDNLGYHAVGAADGAAALAQLDGPSEVALLLTDMVLPGGMSGLDLARVACARSPALEVLYMSGYSDEILAKTGPEASSLRVINKPFRMIELARHLEGVFGGQARSA